jgi:cyclopropane fatty-acyl-phospholipid synthase-like methyltransferase
MIPKGLGQYDQEYANSDCFWGSSPAKYVLRLLEHIKVGRVLDLGAGEGKNAIFLAERGFEVSAVDCSAYGFRNFQRRMSTLHKEVQSRIKIEQANVLEYRPQGQFDAVIAYGLLHCLPSLECVNEAVAMFKRVTSPGGFNVIATFTNKLPVPEVQSYLEPTLLPVGYLETRYADWETLSVENDILEEAHVTTKVSHRHSICRLLTKRPTGSMG